VDKQANGVFEITGWQDSTYDEADGATLGRASVRKKYSGDIDGTSQTEILTALDGAGKPAAYCGLERVSGSLHGRSGSFVVQHAAGESTGGKALLTILPGTGTGELAGLCGTGEIVVTPEGGHTFVLDYELA
jgi:hypothetical protein